jgi:hypothetical protein
VAEDVAIVETIGRRMPIALMNVSMAIKPASTVGLAGARRVIRERAR